MFSIKSGLVVLAAISSVSATVAQGWSLQSASSQTSLHSCGNGAYCPISLHCDTMVGNHEVAACCSSTNDCRGDVEGAPVCSDDSWDMYAGYDGNGFCCESGLIGVYDISKSVAGTCVAAGNVGSSTKATLKTSGTGGSAASSAAPSSTATVTSAPAGTTTAGTSATSSAVVVVSSATTVSSAVTGSSTTGASATTKATLSSTTVAVVPSTTSGSSTTNSTSSAAGTSSTAGSSAGVKTTAGFSLMAVAFVAIAML